MANPDLLSQARSKVERAIKHVNELIMESSSLSNDFYSVGIEEHRAHALAAQPDSFDLTYRPKKPIKEHFSSIIGDAINNLREALEYTIQFAVRAETGRPPTTNIHFPFAEKWHDLVTSRNYISVQRAAPKIANFVLHQIKPCGDTNFNLWTITKLSNTNKHNGFIPNVSVAVVRGVNLDFGVSKIVNSTHKGRDADSPIFMVKSFIPFTMKDEFKVSFDITFEGGSYFPSQPVVPTLFNLAQVTSQTIDAFERFTA